MVRQVTETGPDGCDDSRHGRGTAKTLDAEPEQGEDAACYYGKVREPVSEAGANGDGESDVVIGTDAAVEYSWHRIAEAGHPCNENGISSAEAIQDSARCDLPSGYGKEVAEPIASKRPSRPRASFLWDWVEACQKMWLARSMFSMLR